eukprot:COSAG02_NODE_560_length_20328_cov_15.507343_1_plen_175_part_00
MGRQRPATDTFRAINAGTLERLDRAAQQHQQALKRFKGIGNRSARGTADSCMISVGKPKSFLHRASARMRRHPAGRSTVDRRRRASGSECLPRTQRRPPRGCVRAAVPVNSWPAGSSRAAWTPLVWWSGRVAWLESAARPGAGAAGSCAVCWVWTAVAHVRVAGLEGLATRGWA